MIEELDAVCDVIVRNREIAEDTARLAPEVRQAAGAAGLWVLAAPKEVGGLELALPDLVTVFERLGEADATVAWHASNSSLTGHASARLPADERAAVYAELDAPYGFAAAVTGTMTATRDGDGYRIEGTWPFMTGAADARWATASVAITPPGAPSGAPPEVRRIVVPMASLEVHETWAAASGMRGTGSHAVSAHDVYVPASRSVPLTAEPLIDRPLFRVQPHALGILTGVGIATGTLRSAIAGVVDLVAHKVSRMDGHAHSDDPRVQQTVGDATAAAVFLSAGLARLSEEYWSAIVDGGFPSVETRAPLGWGVRRGRRRPSAGQQPLRRGHQQRLRQPQPRRPGAAGRPCHQRLVRFLAVPAPQRGPGPDGPRADAPHVLTVGSRRAPVTAGGVVPSAHLMAVCPVTDAPLEYSAGLSSDTSTMTSAGKPRASACTRRLSASGAS